MHKPSFLSILIYSLFGVVFLALILSGSFQHVKNTLTDRMYGQENVLQNIVIVSIDDSSIQSLGRWPCNRDVFAKILGKMKDASAIGIDVSFFEESNNDVLLKKE